MIVMGKGIDDIVALDPAQAYEFTSIEVGVNVYRKLVSPGPQQPQQDRPRSRRKLGRFIGRQDVHLPSGQGRTFCIGQADDLGGRGILIASRHHDST